jgi:hypothetical protein
MHFEEQAWIDFVRKLLTAEETWLMQQHLVVGCRECSKAYDFWTRVADMASRDSDYEPPASDIRTITDAFIGANREETVRKMYTPAQLVFDSFHAAAPAGFRSALLQARHLVFCSGPWTISLRIKSESGKQLFIVGQITRAELAGLEPGAEVSLMESDSLLATAASSRSGEFHLQYRETPNLRLIVKVSEVETLEISLPDQDPATEETSFDE